MLSLRSVLFQMLCEFGIREAAKNTTVLIENSISAVEKGTVLVNKTSEDFANIAEKTAQINVIIEDITGKSQEQATAISQISVGIEQISSVVQVNSATSEESAAASEELSSQASVLKELVDKFKFNTFFKRINTYLFEATSILAYKTFPDDCQSHPEMFIY